jgi:phage shock protein C
MDDRLYRSVSDRVLAGVCGGLAQRLEIDPSLVRVTCVIVALVTGIFPILILYVIVAIVVPEEPIGFAARSPTPPGPDAVPGWLPPGGTASPLPDRAAPAGPAAQPAAPVMDEQAPSGGTASPLPDRAAPAGPAAQPAAPVMDEQAPPDGPGALPGAPPARRPAPTSSRPVSLRQYLARKRAQSLGQPPRRPPASP